MIFLLLACFCGGCKKHGGSDSPVEVSISSFSAEPAQIRAGETSVLVWVSVGATSSDIDGMPVVAVGTMIVAPNVTTIYTFTCQGNGGPVSLQVTVEVQDPP